MLTTSLRQQLKHSATLRRRHITGSQLGSGFAGFLESASWKIKMYKSERSCSSKKDPESFISDREGRLRQRRLGQPVLVGGFARSPKQR
jgi:hypothetical protein